MQPWTLFLLCLTVLALATAPLLVVLRSPDDNKYRKLVRVTLFLTFDLIVFGAFTRLTDSGLGCPDWPGCYGLANPFLAHEHIAAAEALLPSGPVTMMKAWIEMIHRAFAGVIGLLSIWIMVWAWRSGRPRLMPVLLFLFICLQGAFGAWTVTMKLQPVIVTTHLLLGMTLFAMLAWLASDLGPGLRRDDGLRASSVIPAKAGIQFLAALSAVVLLTQIALGGWVSTNYATLACTEYPLCAGQLVPEMDLEHGFHLWRELGKTAAGHYLPFTALVAIHWVHRNFALVVALVLGLTAWRAWPHPQLRGPAHGIAGLLLLQFVTGISTIYFSFPLALAILHNAGAAAMVLMVAMLNYRAQHQPTAA